VASGGAGQDGAAFRQKVRLAMVERPLILMTLASGLTGLFGAAGCVSGTSSDGGDSFRAVPIQSHITRVQPMTGIVMWEDSENSRTEAISLEYSYLRYDEVVKARGRYDWSAVERKLNSAASRKHQAVLRFYETWPGHQTTVPEYIKALPDYQETRAKSQGRDTSFPDWSHPEYRRFFLEFYERLAAKYDRDPRLAFLEVGFGLWAEYHIYSGPEVLGKTFPSKEFQAQFFRHLAEVFQETPWMISQDAHEAHRAWAREAANFHITFMICEGWPPRTTMDRIREHSLACGYRFAITAFEVSSTAARVTVRNTGVAPIYYDAFVAVNGVRAEDSLKGLLPGEERGFTVASGGVDPRLTIECDRLVPGQQIEFEANLGTQGSTR
jgi:hypothetical protein